MQNCNFTFILFWSSLKWPWFLRFSCKGQASLIIVIAKVADLADVFVCLCLPLNNFFVDLKVFVNKPWWMNLLSPVFLRRPLGSTLYKAENYLRYSHRTERNIKGRRSGLGPNGDVFIVLSKLAMALSFHSSCPGWERVSGEKWGGRKCHKGYVWDYII